MSARGRLGPIGVVVLAVSARPNGLAQTFDFENGLDGWTRTGTAFDAPPARADLLKSQWFAKVKLGGDYWKGLAYPLGQHGTHLITSGGEQGEAPVGSLTSPEFTLDRTATYFSFLIGGAQDAAQERLDLEIRAPASIAEALAQQIQAWSRSQNPPGRDGDYIIAVTATGNAAEALRQETIAIPEFLWGLPARLRVVDGSQKGHINVDYIRLTASAPDTVRAPAWGYADYHTHPMSYLAFGGLKTPPIPVVFGSPGKNVEYYRVDDFRYKNVSEDIPYCPPRHNGGYLAEQFINEAQSLPDRLGLSISAFLFPHGKSGGPEFKNFPDHLMGAHEQMHITQIRRNYDGGLRLMVALATDDLGAEALTGFVKNRHVDLVREKESIVAQLDGMKHLADLNGSWMKIATSADEARQIILENKLAVILGVEVDQLGTYGYATPEEEVDFLWGLGVRAVTPIHAADNRLGGPAIFEPAYNWLTDFLNRKPNPDLGVGGPEDATADDLLFGPYKGTAFFDVKPDDAPCAGSGGVGKIGECVMYRFSELQFRVAVMRPFYTLFRRTAWILPAIVPPYKNFPGLGQKNTKGLEEYGKRYLDALMTKGMILDTAHMSDLSVSQTYDVIGQRLQARRPDCPGFGFGKVVNPSCDEDAYPAIISHAHFREQAIYDPDEPISAFLPSEYDISKSNLKMVSRTGGVVGPFVTEGRIDKSNMEKIKDDCGMSSKNFAFSFHYALENVPGGVGMATDFTFIPTTAPRFGKRACEGYKPYTHGREERAHPTYGKRYQAKAQNDPIVYHNLEMPKGFKPGSHDPLEPYQMDRRTYNFNFDGLAHYGLVPDMLQDLHDLGLPREDFQALFSSAEGYLKMWEKVERLAGPATGATPGRN
jgi:microsomal dipeptidase-like Zn-dependent dipeptidase